MVPGLILTTGTTVAWLAADAGLLLYVIYHGRFRTHWLPTGLAATVAATALWTPEPLLAVLAASRILLLYAVLSQRPLRNMGRGIAVILALQIVVGLIQLPELDRIHGLSRNASQLGQTGLALTAFGPLAAVTLGLSTSRAAMLGLTIYTVLSRSKRIWLTAGLAFVVFIAVMLYKTPERLEVQNTVQSLDNRELLIVGTPTDEDLAPALDAIGNPEPQRSWQLFGYGYGGYFKSTGLQRPHNLFVLTWWEFGILAPVLWSILAAGVYKLRRRPMVWALLAMSMITEDIPGTAEGIYLAGIAAAVHTPTWLERIPFLSTLRLRPRR